MTGTYLKSAVTLYPWVKEFSQLLVCSLKHVENLYWQCISSANYQHHPLKRAIHSAPASCNHRNQKDAGNFVNQTPSVCGWVCLSSLLGLFAICILKKTPNDPKSPQTQMHASHQVKRHWNTKTIGIPNPKTFGEHPLTTVEQSQNKFQVPPNILVVTSAER